MQPGPSRYKDDLVYDKFRKKLGRNSEGYYETNLIWDESHSLLSDSKYRSIGRLNNLVKNLKRTNKLEAHDNIIQEQRANEIIEKVNEIIEEVNETVSERVFYLPHRPVIRESAEITEIRILYDASAKACQTSTSLNECLETGPLLQNRLWDIIIRSRFRPILLCGDIEKAFLQIRIRESQKDALKFHWVSNLDLNRNEVNRFIRLVFGLTQSPFILEETLKEHFNNYKSVYPELIENKRNDMYVDDLISGGNNRTAELFAKGGFNLHKWHSDTSLLEKSSSNDNDELTYAKQLFPNNTSNTKILGLGWNKASDTLFVIIPTYQQKAITKRNILSYVASIYYPLGFTSPRHW